MDITKIKLKTVMYYVQSFVINAGGTQFEVPRAMISSIDIDKFYDSMIYPLWYVSVGVPLWFYTKITQNTENITVSMNLQYRLADNNASLMSSSGAFTTEIAGNFKAVVPYTTQIEDSTIQQTNAKMSKEYNTNYTYNECAMVELTLYNSNAYKASFNKINAVLTSSNLTDAFTYCINQCGITNVLLSKADNNKTYTEFKILPVSGVENIMRIVEDYKFHNNGSIIFFDLIDSYLLPKKVGCTAWKTNEYKSTNIICMAEYSEALSNFSGIYIDTVEKTNIISVEKNAFVTENITGAPQFTNTGETSFLSFKTQKALLSLFTPNKEFIVGFDSPANAKYNGKYRIYRLSCTMRPSGEMLDPEFTIILRR